MYALISAKREQSTEGRRVKYGGKDVTDITEEPRWKKKETE